jgi:Flp pilus assembly protein TadD
LLALAAAGSLTDFGYDVGGVRPRGAAIQPGLKSASEFLTRAADDELEVILNRGHLYLAQGRYEQAEAEFQKATLRAPGDSWGWLGLGLVAYMKDDFRKAEQAFRHSLELEPNNVAVKMNLAMALEEQKRSAEALDLWKSLNLQRLTPKYQKAVQRAVDHLRADADQPPESQP